VAEGGRGMFTGIDFLARPCVPSPVSSIRTPKLPLLHVWEKGASGDEGSVPDESQDYAAASASRSLPSSIPSGAAPSMCTTSSITVRGTPITS
jgi:hypothetical protein